MAVDGCTHERHAIEEWFKMKDVQLVEAEIELQLTPVQVHVQRGIVKPSGMTIAGPLTNPQQQCSHHN